MKAHRDEFSIARMCAVLGVSVSGYYDWCERPVSQREQANAALVAEIRQVHAESLETYGSPRMHKELCERGWPCSRNRIERLMRQYGIRGKCKRRRKVVTTDSQHKFPVAPNLLNQEFQAEAPNRKWLTDITYVSTAEGWLYLACVLDLFSRKIVGWAMDDTMTTSLVTDALDMALQQRQPGLGLLHHSDRGSQYASLAYQERLADHYIQVSMSRTGNCYDNAVMESFWATLKTERIHDQTYRTRAEARTDIFLFIEGFYNRRRRHSALGYLSPDQFERNFYLGI